MRDRELGTQPAALVLLLSLASTLCLMSSPFQTTSSSQATWVTMWKASGGKLILGISPFSSSLTCGSALTSLRRGQPDQRRVTLRLLRLLHLEAVVVVRHLLRQVQHVVPVLGGAPT